MDKNWEKSPWQSSYEGPNYGGLFCAIVKVQRPKLIVELGTKAGFSAFHMAQGLRDNTNKGFPGRIEGYDLWEDYPYTHVPKSLAERNLTGVADVIKLIQADARDVQPYETDMLHVDLSNDGKLLEEIVEPWLPKVNMLTLIEGGSLERDDPKVVDWMGKYGKTPVRGWLNKIRDQYDNFTFEPFPSLTLIRRKNI